MIETILAEINWEGLTGALAILAAGGIGASQIRTNRTVKRTLRQSDEGVCPVHDSVMTLLDERKQNADQDRKDIKDAVKALSDHTDQGFKIMFNKLDAISTSIKNGQSK